MKSFINTKICKAKTGPSKLGLMSQPGFYSLPMVFLATLMLASGAWAHKMPLSNFEVEGDLTTGVVEPGAGGTITPPYGVDWSPRDNADEDCSGGAPFQCSALLYELPGDGDQCPGEAVVCDNPDEPGLAVFFQDGLKSEGDLTTFGQGDKENDYAAIELLDAANEDTLKSATPWHIVPGNIPPNKDDLFNTYAYSLIEGGDADVVLAFERTSNLGTSHVDFELNRLPWVPCEYQPDPNAPEEEMVMCPERAEGDLLISYELSGGGTVSSVQVYVWELPGGIDADGNGEDNCVGYVAEGGNRSAPCPWQEINIDTNNPLKLDATLNTNGEIPAGAWGSKAPDGTPTTFIPEFGFFETFLDFDALGFGPGCPGFAYASLKSRSSDSVTSAIKDLAGPFPLDVNNCGKIIVKKTTEGGDGSFSFTGDVEGSITTVSGVTPLGQELSSGQLAEGTYSVAETSPGSMWDLDSSSCDDGSTVDAIILGPAEVVTCTFHNIKRGDIKLVKNTVGGDGTFSFTHTISGLDPSLTTSAGTAEDTSGPLDPASTYGITEDGETGWDLTSKACVLSDGTPTGSGSVPPDGEITGIEVQAGKTTTCTYTNTKQGSIIVKKVTVGGDGSFGFSGDITATLSNGESSTPVSVSPGTYSATETVPSGWDLTGISCDDANSSGNTGTGVATFNVEAGETVTCTFTNTKRGIIIVEKQTNPDGAPGSFSFSGDASGSIGDGGKITVNNLVPGTYTATEADPTALGFKLESISCDDGASGTASSGNVTTRTATFKLDPGETVKCTFTNSTGAIKVTKTAKNYTGGGEVAHSGVTFTASASGYPGGFGDTDSNGQVCIDGLVPGVQYSVTETVPAGYQAAGDNPKLITVTAGATCTSGTPDPISFVNDPLSEIRVIFSSLAGPNVTAASIVCADGSGPIAAVSENGSADPAFDDTDETFTNLKEGTYTCTIIIDP